MTTNSEHTTAYNWARQSLEKLILDGLAPYPENYSVYYFYFSGGNANLKMAMDLLLRVNGSLTQEQCTSLYNRHIGLDAEHQVLREANAAIEIELAKVLDAIGTTASNTEEYGKTLNVFEGKLNDLKSLDQIREVLAKVTHETQVISKQNERLQTQLSSTTDQLIEMRQNLDTVHKESQIDPLTEVGNRKYFNKELSRLLKEATENGSPLSFLMVDIDHFKKVNDTYGHIIGDQVLKLVARTLVENLKGRDVIARYGGEEFVIVLAQTRLEDAEKVANQLRTSLATKHVKRRQTNELIGVITVSVGATQYILNEDSETLIARADAALYKAKQTGRNKVVVAERPVAAETATATPDGTVSGA